MERDCESKLSKLNIEQNACIYHFGASVIHGQRSNILRLHIIYVDDRLPEHIILFVIAHELGHVFLHKNSNAIFMDTRTHFVKNKYENEANLFAMNLLISDEDIEEHLEYTTSQLSRLFGYEKSLIELRLKSFN